MRLKEFLEGNPWAVFAAAAFTTALLIAFAASLLHPAPAKQEGGQAPTQPAEEGPFSLLPQNCTPFFNQSARASYSYNLWLSMDGGRSAAQASRAFATNASMLIITDTIITSGRRAAMEWELDENLTCKRARIRMSVAGGGEYSREFPCIFPMPVFGSPCAEGMREKGSERVSVPLGSMVARVFSFEPANATYWVVDKIQVPVKFSAGAMEGELVSYEE